MATTDKHRFTGIIRRSLLSGFWRIDAAKTKVAVRATLTAVKQSLILGRLPQLKVALRVGSSGLDE